MYDSEVSVYNIVDSTPYKKDANGALKETYSLIHKLQPQALIGNNYHQPPISGEDFQMFERDLQERIPKVTVTNQKLDNCLLRDVPQ